MIYTSSAATSNLKVYNSLIIYVMFFRKIVLENYLPFSHVGNKRVEIRPASPGVAINGGNGSGKSSLLRAIGVTPWSRSDFGKNGSVLMEVEHNGAIYQISADFSNAAAPNHFIKDGKELNIGGTGETQKDLVEEHLGLNNAIWDLLSGGVNICELPASARKKLFSTHYPSDLTFVLEYHKKVCSQIRAYGNQLKLLQGREGSYRASLMDPAELEKLREERDTYLLIIDRIDKFNLLLENEIMRLRENEAMKHEYHPEDLDDIIHRFNVLRQAYVHEFLNIDRNRNLGEKIDASGLEAAYSRLNAELKHAEQDKERITASLVETRDELNKFANIKYASKDDKRLSLTNELNVVNMEIGMLEKEYAWKDKPLIPFDKLIDTVEIERDISDMVNNLKQYSGSLMGAEQISLLKNDITIAKNTIATLNREKLDLTDQLTKAEDRLSKLTKNSYPQDCTRACPLRATVESSVRDVKLRIEALKSRLDAIDKHMTASAELIAENDAKYREIAPSIPVMRMLWDTLTANYLGEIALQGEDYVECLNNRATEIINRVRNAVDYSKKYHRHKNLVDRKENITHTLAMMKTMETAQLSAEVIEGIIADRERKINDGVAKLSEIENICDKLASEMERITDIGSLLRDVARLTERTKICLNIKLIRNRIEFDQEIIREHLSLKNHLSTRLREIERVLQDQKRLSDILNTETLPQLELIKKQKARWEAVEAGLSPSKGLPCIYLVRFINKLIERANALIREVWDHDMELVFLSEDDDLDFTLQVMHNKSTVVKDVSWCSMGEQTMINLAMTLAICMERGYLKQYAIKLDETDAALTENHRSKLVQMIGRLLAEGEIKQLFMVSHFFAQTGIPNVENVVLSTDGIVLPNSYNENVTITK